MLYFFDEYVLDTDRRELRRGDRLIPVEPKVFDLLAYLIEGRERVVSKEALIAEVWSGRVVSESALASCINAARNAVGDSGESQRLIKTLPRKGLRFVGTVRQENSLTGRAPSSAAPTTPGSALDLPDWPSVAVLPFTNLGNDEEQQYFADGLAEDIITRLGRLKSILVCARNSSFTYKGRTVDVPEGGQAADRPSREFYTLDPQKTPSYWRI